MLGDGDPESVCNVAQPRQAGRAVLVCLITLYLLLSHAERLGKLTLVPSAGYARLDKYGRQLFQGCGVECHQLTAAQEIEVGQLSTKVISLGSQRIDLELRKLGSLTWTRFNIGDRLLEAF